MVRETAVVVRVRPHQRSRWVAKAKARGMTLSQWLRDVADRDARM